MTTPPAAPADRARRIQIRTRRLVAGIFAGHYRSVFRGSGIEFDEVREYTPGDDVRSIDWNVTARLGAPHVKRHVEERDLTLMLAVDVSGSGRFGSGSRLKIEMAALICATLADSAARSNDDVGLLLFSDRVESYLPPRKGRHRTLRTIFEVLNLQPAGTGTDLALALDHLRQVLHRRAVVVLVSDFLASGYAMALRAVARRHEVIPIVVSDPLERRLPPWGILSLRDLESGRQVLVDARDPTSRRRHEEAQATAAAARRELFAGLGLDAIELDAAGDHIGPILRFFRRREQRRVRHG